jgi:type II secretory pathway component PulF
MFARLGEQTGQLPQMLTHAAEHLVMLIVLAVMLPIIELNQFVQ